MAKQAGMGCALYAGGCDVGGDTQAFSVHGGPVALDLTDITQSAFFRLGGARSAEVNWTSVIGTAAGPAHDCLARQPRPDPVETVRVQPGALRRPAASPGMQLNRQCTTPV